jgi:hypothetical protein
VRWHIAIIASVALAACETNEATDVVDVTTDDLEGVYELTLVGGDPVNTLDPDYCLNSDLTLDDDGDFVVALNFDERVAVGTGQACRTDADRTQVDIEWHGSYTNISTLVVLSIEEVVTTVTVGDSTVSSSSDDNTELTGEYNPDTDRLVLTFPEIWGFDPHGGSGGKINIGGSGRGLGGGTLVFER